jgi:hypothetical protein
MAEPFDPSLYVRSPIVNASTGATLALALAGACPKDAPANVKKAAKHLSAVAAQVQEILAERNRRMGTFSEDDSRKLDNEADRAWGALRMRIEAMAMLNPSITSRATRAAELRASLFAEGTEFLKEEYASQRTSMGALLKRIDDEKLEKDIDAVAGKEFLQAVRSVQPRYDAMVNERLRRDQGTGTNLADSVRAIQAAIVNYAAKVIGTIEHDDPSTVEAARVALLPIANFRAAATREVTGTILPPAPAEDKAAGEPKPA